MPVICVRTLGQRTKAKQILGHFCNPLRMFGFVVVFSFLWVVWAISPLSAPVFGPTANPFPDMAVVLGISGLAVLIAARVYRSRLFIRCFSSRLGAFAAVALFVLSAYPPVYLSAKAMMSEPVEATGWLQSMPGLFAGMLDAYSLPGLVLVVVSSAWITTMLMRDEPDG